MSSSFPLDPDAPGLRDAVDRAVAAHALGLPPWRETCDDADSLAALEEWLRDVGFIAHGEAENDPCSVGKVIADRFVEALRLMPPSWQALVVTEYLGWEAVGVRDTNDGLLHVCDFAGGEQPEPQDQIVYAPRREA